MLKLYNLHTVIDFGQFKGKTIKDLTEIPDFVIIHLKGEDIAFPEASKSYIDWCAREVDFFYMDTETVELIEQLKPSMKLSEKAKMVLVDKEKIWLQQNKRAQCKDDYVFTNKLKDMLGKNLDMSTDAE